MRKTIVDPGLNVRREVASQEWALVAAMVGESPEDVGDDGGGFVGVGASVVDGEGDGFSLDVFDGGHRGSSSGMVMETVWIRSARGTRSMAMHLRGWKRPLTRVSFWVGRGEPWAFISHLP
jgi:hypothetical protein